MSIFIKKHDLNNDIMTAEGVHDVVYDLIKDSKYILDVGCGTGVFANTLQICGHIVEACGLENCKYNIPFKNVDFNTQLLPYNSNTFDAVTAIEIIEHINNPHLFIEELHRVTKKGGLVIITSPNVENWYMRIYYLLTGKLLGFNYITMPTDAENNHISPIIWQIYKPFIEKYFIIEEIITNRSFIPLLRIKLPFTNMFFADTRILKLRKK